MRSPHFCPTAGSPYRPHGANMSGGSIMGLPIPTLAELSPTAWSVRAKRNATAEKLLTDRVMTREELIKHGLLSDKYVN